MQETSLRLGVFFRELVDVARRRHGVYVSMILAELFGETLGSLLEKRAAGKQDPSEVVRQAAALAADLLGGEALEATLSSRGAVVRVRIGIDHKGVPELMGVLEKLFNVAARIAFGPKAAYLTTTQGDVLEVEFMQER